MKQFLLSITAMLVLTNANAQNINIPDANFKAALVNASTFTETAKDANGYQMVIDTNHDGEIQLSEAAQVVEMKLENKQIASLEGIVSFQNLVNLNCSYNNIVALDVTGMNALRIFNCRVNLLTSLNVTGMTNLVELVCASNNLTTLDVHGLVHLKLLTLGSNFISTVDVSGMTELEQLELNFDPIQTIDTSSLINLKGLGAGWTHFQTLDLSASPYLEEIYCPYSQLTSLTLSSNHGYLKNVYCPGNQLTALDISGYFNLERLECSSNPLSSLTLTGLDNLKYLNCSQSNITELDAGALYGLEELHVFTCPLLTSINIKNGSFETISFYEDPALQTVCTDDFQLTLVQLLATQEGYTSDVNSNCALANESFVSNKTISIYPNPAATFVNINSVTAITSVAIFNVLGQTVLETSKVESKSIDVSALEAGTYFMHIKTGDTNTVVKFIKTNHE
jgi:hypothetical protein